LGLMRDAGFRNDGGWKLLITSQVVRIREFRGPDHGVAERKKRQIRISKSNLRYIEVGRFFGNGGFCVLYPDYVSGIQDQFPFTIFLMDYIISRLYLSDEIHESTVFRTSVRI